VNTNIAQFMLSLPPPVTYERWRIGNNISVDIRVSETLRRDLKLAADSDMIPADAKFWVRDAQHEPLSYVELSAWPGSVLATDYVATLMDQFICARSVGPTGPQSEAGSQRPLGSTVPMTSPQDIRFSPEVNGALELLKILADRIVAAAEPYRVDNTYRVEVRSDRLRLAAELGLRIEVDPIYSAFMLRAREAATRLGRAVVRQLCGEGGVDFATEEALKELVRVDEEACGRPVLYKRGSRRWEVDQRITCTRCNRRFDARRFDPADPALVICTECTFDALFPRPRP